MTAKQHFQEFLNPSGRSAGGITVPEQDPAEARAWGSDIDSEKVQIAKGRIKDVCKKSALRG